MHVYFTCVTQTGLSLPYFLKSRNLTCPVNPRARYSRSGSSGERARRPSEKRGENERWTNRRCDQKFKLIFQCTYVISNGEIHAQIFKYSNLFSTVRYYEMRKHACLNIVLVSCTWLLTSRTMFRNLGPTFQCTSLPSARDLHGGMKEEQHLLCKHRERRFP